MRAIRLRTEYLRDPMGIDILNPRIMWNCGDWTELKSAAGAKQTAYQIVTDQWDSGKVESSSMQAVYPLELKSRERVNYKIRLWDGDGEPGEWAESFFEMGLLDPVDWKGKWITGDYVPKKNERYPVDCFRKAFETGKAIEKARLYITACGVSERSRTLLHHRLRCPSEAGHYFTTACGVCFSPFFLDFPPYGYYIMGNGR